MSDRTESLEKALEKAVSRALRDNLVPLQHTADDVLQAYADLVAACGSARPTNALPALIRAQTAAASLSAGLSVLSNFVTAALKSRENAAVLEAQELAAVTAPSAKDAGTSPVHASAPGLEIVAAAPVVPPPIESEEGVELSSDSEGDSWAESELELEPDQPFVHEIEPQAEYEAAAPQASAAPSEIQMDAHPPAAQENEPDVQAHWEDDVPMVSLGSSTETLQPLIPPVSAQSRASLFEDRYAKNVPPLGLAAHHMEMAEQLAAAKAPEAPVEDQPAAETGIVAEPFVEEAPHVESSAFDVSALTSEAQDLHRRANRVAKVAMQDIKLLRPKDVRLGREHKDICVRLRSDIDKARKEYDRRFHAILDQPVDYFHCWMVEILAEGDSEALGEYPYPSPVLRH